VCCGARDAVGFTGWAAARGSFRHQVAQHQNDTIAVDFFFYFFSNIEGQGEREG